MQTLNIGDKAPDFTLPDAEGNMVTLSKLPHKTVVLYFYPKDDTPGCTREACNLRDNYEALKSAGLIIYGISTDTKESHQKFAKKYTLPFPLLSDERHKVAEKYGAWGEKTMYGKKYAGMFRITYIISPERKIQKIFADKEKVDVDNHSAQIQAAMK